MPYLSPFIVLGCHRWDTPRVNKMSHRRHRRSVACGFGIRGGLLERRELGALPTGGFASGEWQVAARAVVYARAAEGRELVDSGGPVGP